MADIKISQLTAKGTAIASTDLLEISESNGSGGYVTKSVTGANIIGSKQDILISGTNIKTINSNSILGSGNLVITGGVSSVSATTPVVATGTTTPVISLASAYGDTLNPYASKTANHILAAPNGTAGVPTFRAIVGADIPTLNQNTTGTATNVTGIVAVANGGTGTATPALVAGTNITLSGTFPNQTINASGGGGGVTQIVAGTNVTLSPAGGTGVVTVNASGGGGGGEGAHVRLKPISGRKYGARINSTSIFATSNLGGNAIYLYPFIPVNSLTIQNMEIDNPSSVAGGLKRLLIYSNLNGVPSSKLLETSSFDCSTTGIKTFTTSFTFTAGTTYWLGFYSNIGISFFTIDLSNAIPISNGIGNAFSVVTVATTFPNAPDTLGAATLGLERPISILLTAL